MKTFFVSLIAALALSIPLASAQTVSVTGHLVDGSGNAVPGAYLHFALYNCGTNYPVISGNGLAIVNKSFDLQPNSAGLITGTIWPNDKILCGNIASTLWTVTLMKSGATPLNAAQRYFICSSSETLPICGQPGGPGAVFDPSTAQPAQVGSQVNYIPPQPGYILLFANPVTSQAWTQPSGTQAQFFGSFDFVNGLLVGSTTFSNLSTVYPLANEIYVSDAVSGSSPCAGGGGGSWAFYQEGAWTCGLGSGGGGGGSGSAVAPATVSFSSVSTVTLPTTFISAPIVADCWDLNNNLIPLLGTPHYSSTTPISISFNFQSPQPQSGHCDAFGIGPNGPPPPPPPGQFSLTPATFNFDQVALGSTSQPQIFTLNNATSSTVTGITIAIPSSTNSADFLLSLATASPCGSSLAAGANCTLQVQFSPKLTTVETAAITVTDSAGTQSASLSGQGFGTSILTINPSTLNFGGVDVGSSATQIITLCAASGTNCAQASGAVSITSIGPPSDTVNYQVFNHCPTTLQSGQSCGVSVICQPRSAGTFNGVTIPIASTAVGSPQNITANCTGTTPTTKTLSSISLAPVNPSTPIGTNVVLTATETFSDASTQVMPANTVVYNAGSGSSSTEALVNGTGCGHSSALSKSCASVTSVAGDSIWTFGYVASTTAALTFTDSLGDNYTCDTPVISDSLSVICHTVVLSTGANVITVHSTTSNSLGLAYAEFSGTANVSSLMDPGLPGGVGQVCTVGCPNTSVTTGNFTTQGSSDILFGCTTDNVSGSFTVGSGFTLIPASDTTFSAACEYAINKAAGTYAATFTDPSSTNTWVAEAAAGTSGNTQVATVAQNGTVTPITTGTAAINVNSGYVAQQSSSGACGNNNTGIITVPCPFPGAQAANNTNVALIAWRDATASISSITDSTGNIYTRGCHLQGSGLSGELWYSQGIAAASSNTVTVIWVGGGAANPGIKLVEMNGLVGGLDGACVSSSAATPLCTAGPLTTTQAADVLIGLCVPSANGGVGTVFLNGTGVAAGMAADGLGNVGFAIDLFASGAQTVTTSGGPSELGLVAAFKSVIGTDSVTVTSGASRIWSVQNQQPVSSQFYQGSIFHTVLPSSADSTLISNSDAIVSNMFGGSIANSTNGPNYIVNMGAAIGGPGAFTNGAEGSFCYSTQGDPIYEVVSATHVVAGHDPTGKFFHLKQSCPFDGGEGDQFLYDIDQSLDIDSTVGGRILGGYFFAHGASAIIPNACTCTTTGCAQVTSSCQLSLYYTAYAYPYSDTVARGEGGGCCGSIGTAPAAAFLREQEIVNGAGHHALIGVSSCVLPGPSFPATGDVCGCGTSCAPGTSASDVNRPHNGALFKIDATYNCLSAEVWAQEVCFDLQGWGLYHSDTGGGAANIHGGIALYDPSIEGPQAFNIASLTPPIYSYLDTYCTVHNGGEYDSPSGALRCFPNNTSTVGVYMAFFAAMPNLLSNAGDGHMHLRIVDPCIPEQMAGLTGHTCSGSPTD